MDVDNGDRYDSAVLRPFPERVATRVIPIIAAVTKPSLVAKQPPYA
ncbi:hypothetical protein SAMN02927895_00802 [Belnapia rosea]|nr:hypothetical protein SAMN02927895_00802 [Belnapia rosea]